MDSIDWLQQLDREAWAARIRQLRRELQQERDTTQRPSPPKQVDLTDSPGRPTRQPSSATQ